MCEQIAVMLNRQKKKKICCEISKYIVFTDNL